VANPVFYSMGSCRVPESGSGSRWKKYLPPSKGDPAKNLYTKISHSQFQSDFGLSRKGKFVQWTNIDTTQEDKNIRNVVGPPAPLTNRSATLILTAPPPPPVGTTGSYFLSLGVKLTDQSAPRAVYSSVRVCLHGAKLN